MIDVITFGLADYILDAGATTNEEKYFQNILSKYLRTVEVREKKMQSRKLRYSNLYKAARKGTSH